MNITEYIYSDIRIARLRQTFDTLIDTQTSRLNLCGLMRRSVNLTILFHSPILINNLGQYQIVKLSL